MGKNAMAVLEALTKAGEPLGLMRLQAVTGIDKVNLWRTLQSLVDMEKVRCDAFKKEWGLPRTAEIIPYSEFTRRRALRIGKASGQMAVAL
jgi:DNA-binding IclR family transcriptional regulator